MGGDGVEPPEPKQLIYSQPCYQLQYIHPNQKYMSNLNLF